ncbi:hypothetical protein CapIbe_021786 [Capra ibex]
MALLGRARLLRGTAGLRTEPENHPRARRAGARSRSPDRPRIRRFPQRKPQSLGLLSHLRFPAWVLKAPPEHSHIHQAYCSPWPWDSG